MGRLRQFSNSSILMLLILSLVLTLKSIYQDVQYLGTKPRLKRNETKLIPRNLVCKGTVTAKGLILEPSDILLCMRELQRGTRFSLGDLTHYSKYPSDAVVMSRLRYGGFYKPKGCASSGKTAILIPYRDRPEHLEVLLNHLHGFLQRQQIQYGVFVIEMALPTQFNRGLLANAGFLTARSIGNYSCYVIHDVDLLPTNVNNFYTCGKGPRHLITNCTKYKKGLPYKLYVGGVLAMTPAQYLAVNGYSNLYFGWGGEDDDMGKRINASKLILERPEETVGTYSNLEHTGDSSNPWNPHKKNLLKFAVERQHSDGLTSMNFQRQSLEFRQKYTWILVKADERQIMEKFTSVKATFDLGEKRRSVISKKVHEVKQMNLKNAQANVKGPHTNVKDQQTNVKDIKTIIKHQQKSAKVQQTNIKDQQSNTKYAQTKVSDPKTNSKDPHSNVKDQQPYIKDILPQQTIVKGQLHHQTIVKGQQTNVNAQQTNVKDTQAKVYDPKIDSKDQLTNVNNLTKILDSPSQSTKRQRIIRKMEIGKPAALT